MQAVHRVVSQSWERCTCGLPASTDRVLDFCLGDFRFPVRRPVWAKMGFVIFASFPGRPVQRYRQGSAVLELPRRRAFQQCRGTCLLYVHTHAYTQVCTHDCPLPPSVCSTFCLGRFCALLSCRPARHSAIAPTTRKLNTCSAPWSLLVSLPSGPPVYSLTVAITGA